MRHDTYTHTDTHTYFFPLEITLDFNIPQCQKKNHGFDPNKHIQHTEK